ncbi:hypothetical protein [Agrobacterium tumefaciens]|uniref:hypothetical protein n=1 Tax=Agrobacterium tumefaciens TaxID=358 RepID=UPI003BA379D2
MRHPKLIVLLRELQGNPDRWWRNEARKTARYDGGIAQKQLERLERAREESLPAYWVVYLQLGFIVVLIVGIAGF